MSIRQQLDALKRGLAAGADADFEPAEPPTSG